MIRTAKQVEDAFLLFYEQERDHVAVRRLPVPATTDLWIPSDELDAWASMLPGLAGAASEDAGRPRRMLLTEPTETPPGAKAMRNATPERMICRTWGDYFKETAIIWAWQFLTESCGLDGEQLHVTFFAGQDGTDLPSDDESPMVWQGQTSLPADNLHASGLKNWQLSNKGGPCGARCCIFYNHRGDGDFDFDSTSPHSIEIARLTFLQYERAREVHLIPLDVRRVESVFHVQRIQQLLEGKDVPSAAPASAPESNVTDAHAPRTATRLPRVAIISIPKSGTNLLLSLIQRALPAARTVDLMSPEGFRNTHSRRDNYFQGNLYARRLIEKTPAPAIFHTHSPFSDFLLTTLWEYDVKTIFLVRDPRAVAVSFVDYVMKNDQHPAHPYFTQVLPDLDARLRVAILGTDPQDPNQPFVPDLAGAWQRFARWLRQPEVLQLRYEGLVGVEFGGWGPRQRENVQRIVDHLDLELSAAEIDVLIGEGTAPERSVTFHKGGIQRWREAFSTEMEALFEEHAGEILDVYKYSK